jgi:hypothetical protein
MQFYLIQQRPTDHNGPQATTKGHSLRLSNSVLADQLERIDFALKDIRETLLNFPADNTHPYVIEKLAERDTYLTRWMKVTSELRANFNN